MSDAPMYYTRSTCKMPPPCGEGYSYFKTRKSGEACCRKRSTSRKKATKRKSTKKATKRASTKKEMAAGSYKKRDGRTVKLYKLGSTGKKYYKTKSKTTGKMRKVYVKK